MQSIKFTKYIGLGLCAMCFNSCGYVNEDLAPCPEPSAVELRFTYFKNMAYADGFNTWVHCLGAYFFDKDGVLVKSVSEPDDTYISDPAYTMRVELDPGYYTVLAYGGMECDKASFYHDADIVPGKTTLEEFNVEMHLQGVNGKNNELHRHFYGRKTFEVLPETTTKEVVDVMRNTNNIQVGLMHIRQTEINHNDFVFEITDDNNSLDFMNRLRDSGELTYSPFASRTQEAVIYGDPSSRAGEEEGETRGIAAIAAFSVSKLETTRNPQLKVTRADNGQEVFKVDLPYYLSMFMTEHEGINTTEDTQDYLDRENSWQLMFFLDDGTDLWINTYIQIQDWFVRLNSAEF